jgi:predicted CXXCH cytochrome family protein
LSSQVCGQCHSISSYAERDWTHGQWNRFRPGQQLADTANVVRPKRPESLQHIREQLEADPEFLRGRYWKDGVVRVSGREYNGMIESDCFAGGELSCLSCHTMHHGDPNDQLKAGMNGDQACLQCHAKFAQDIPAHTHHAAESSGSRCYNCHMPHTTYGLLKAIRSHTIASPTVASSLETGRPNACNQCHLDRTLAWTQEHLQAWYNTPPVELDDDEQHVSAMVLWLLRGDAGQRALAAWSMGWEDARQASGEAWLALYLAHLLDDPYAAVRFITERSLRRLPDFAELKYDFVGPAGERRRVQQAAMEQVERNLLRLHERAGGVSPPSPSAPSPSEKTEQVPIHKSPTLIDDRGQLDRATFERLSKQRDDRPIDLQE